jgi:hypothetical protein
MKKAMATNAATAHAEIERLAKEKAVPELRYVERMEIGQVVRQGDIYIHRVADSHPRGKRLESHQLAIGETTGSRHTVEAHAEVYEGTTLPDYCSPGTFLGPLVTAKERTLYPHPEHAHYSLPRGTYQVTHQMDARTLERVKD